MAEATGFLAELLGNIRKIREQRGVTAEQLEERLILGPGWIDRFETGETIPGLDLLMVILSELDASVSDLLDGLPDPEPTTINRCIFAEQDSTDLTVHFRYANFDAQYRLPQASVEQFEEVIKKLRDRLSGLDDPNVHADALIKAIKREAVVASYVKAMELWPHANPSDVWWFIVYRAYCDPFNHPAEFARLDHSQSWKRTGGWALEEIAVRHYRQFLAQNGIKMFIADAATKQQLIGGLAIDGNLVADKVDVVLTGNQNGTDVFFGVVHVKASFAERRTDDQPMSELLIANGFTSPLWTMDCKSTPAQFPINRGELGPLRAPVGPDRRSDKRRDIEDNGVFTGCFSYNRNTLASPTNLPAERRVYVCDFSNPDDAFARFIISRWQDFQGA